MADILFSRFQINFFIILIQQILIVFVPKGPTVNN